MEKPKTNFERITYPAILTTKGRTLTGRSHPQIMSQIDYKSGERVAEEGFLTSNDRFVGRRLAAQIFRASKQTTHTGKELPENVKELDSDHLYRF